MSDFKAKMHQIRYPLRPRLHHVERATALSSGQIIP